MTEAERQALLERLETGVALRDPALLARAAELPAELLADRLAASGGHVGCDLAYLLARRHDPRGIAALARAACDPARAGRALDYLAELDMLDMVPPEYRTEAARDRAAALDLLGAEPRELEVLLRLERAWPGAVGPQPVALFRFRDASPSAGLVLVQPVRLRVDGGADSLDADDALALVCGACFEPRLQLRDPAEVPDEAIAAVVKQRAYLYPAEPRLKVARWHAERWLLALAVRRPRAWGYLVGSSTGQPPAQWFEARSGLTADHAFRIWFGRLLLAGW